jgi:hypothetical protein
VPPQQPALAQVAHQVDVGVLEELAADEGDVGAKVPSGRTGLTTGRP